MQVYLKRSVRFLIITANVFLTACALTPPSPKASAFPEPPMSSRPGYTFATRSEADCMSLSRGFAADSFAAITLHADADEPRGASIKSMFKMNLLFAQTLHEYHPYRVEFRFDERGVVVPDSIRVIGTSNKDVVREVRAAAKKMEAWPAVRNNCAVPAWYVIYGGVGPMTAASQAHADLQTVPNIKPYIPAMRTAADCIGLSQGPAADSFAILRRDGPRAKKIVMGDMRLIQRGSADDHQYSVDLRIDPAGHVVPDSIKIVGVPLNGPWGRELRRASLAMEFLPGVRDGCAVPGRWSFRGGKIFTPKF